MANFPIEIIPVGERTVFGLWTKSNDRAVAKDIGALSRKYYATAGLPEGSVLPFFVVSRNYDGGSGDFELLVGGTAEKAGLEKLALPPGDYAKMEIRAKLGLLWGPAIGEAKRFFYIKWLPASQYRGLNLEYEFHTEKAVGKRPSIDLLFAIQRKN